jgi:hypothetical protein
MIIKNKDFYQSAVLKSIGYKLLKLEKENGNKFFYFIFEDKEGTAESDIAKYWNYEIRVDARRLVECIKELKTRIYSDN